MPSQHQHNMIEKESASSVNVNSYWRRRASRQEENDGTSTTTTIITLETMSLLELIHRGALLHGGPCVPVLAGQVLTVEPNEQHENEQQHQQRVGSSSSSSPSSSPIRQQIRFLNNTIQAVLDLTDDNFSNDNDMEDGHNCFPQLSSSSSSSSSSSRNNNNNNSNNHRDQAPAAQ